MYRRVQTPMSPPATRDPERHRVRRTEVTLSPLLGRFIWPIRTWRHATGPDPVAALQPAKLTHCAGQGER
jgi:hypothetical protein